MPADRPIEAHHPPIGRNIGVCVGEAMRRTPPRHPALPGRPRGPEERRPVGPPGQGEVPGRRVSDERGGVAFDEKIPKFQDEGRRPVIPWVSDAARGNHQIDRSLGLPRSRGSRVVTAVLHAAGICVLLRLTAPGGRRGPVAVGVISAPFLVGDARLVVHSETRRAAPGQDEPAKGGQPHSGREAAPHPESQRPHVIPSRSRSDPRTAGM
jgi:hypothetical protein